MFELDENQQFLTRNDMVLARLYNGDINAECTLRNYDKLDDSEGMAPIHRVRAHVRYLGHIVEFNRDHPYPGGMAYNFFKRDQIGYHVAGNVYLIKVYAMLQNHNHRDAGWTPYLRPTLFFDGALGFATFQAECQEDMDWWLSHMIQFRDQPQVKYCFR